MATASNTPQRIVIIGATSGIAEHCARLWAQQGASHLVLVARNQEKLTLIEQDLRVRNPALHIRCQTGNFTDPASIQQLVDRIADEACPDIVLIAHGTLPDQSQCQQDLAANADALVINGLSPVWFAEAFVTRMVAAGRGTVA
ncbi:MAG: SDR family NAD(P)-dependent oxidoreductase, partial [Pseudohongiella sp.]|nr:SDR family NAD(P)-dependent oxidoreductase [Pseudohongiella sp.]